MSDPQAPTVPCPFCQESIQPDARRCRHCGEDLGADAGPASAASPPADDAKLLKNYRQHKNSLGLVCLLVAGLNGWTAMAAFHAFPVDPPPQVVTTFAVTGGLALLATALGIAVFLHQYWAFATSAALFGLFLVGSILGGIGEITQTIGSAGQIRLFGCGIGCNWIILLLAVGEAGTVMGSWKKLRERGLSPRGGRL